MVSEDLTSDHSYWKLLRNDGTASVGFNPKANSGGQDKAICLCATIYKGGGNNSVTYVVKLYEK